MKSLKHYLKKLRLNLMNNLMYKLLCTNMTKTVYLKIIITSFTMYAIVMYSLRMHMRQLDERARAQSSEVVVHLDMKGSLPKLGYMKNLLTLIKEKGATGVLLEYDDMFCYQGELAITNAPYCYLRDELTDFLTDVAALNLTLIPLVQCLGHLEALLQQDPYKNLMESYSDRGSICTSNNKSKELLQDRLMQVLEFHDRIQPLKYVHIGFNQVFNIKACKVCAARNVSESQMYLEHLSFIKNSIRKRYPDVSILFWADVLETIPDQLLLRYDIKSLTPVNWFYGPTSPGNMESIKSQLRYFRHVWVSTAFKGADGTSSKIPDNVGRYQNHFYWMTMLNKLSSSISQTKRDKKLGGVGGIVLSGRARYSYFMPLCDPLPAALPVLTLCLATINYLIHNSHVSTEGLNPQYFYIHHIMPLVTKDLQCDSAAEIYSYNFSYHSCAFYGLEFYELLWTSALRPGSQLFQYMRPSEVTKVVKSYYDYPQSANILTML